MLHRHIPLWAPTGVMALLIAVTVPVYAQTAPVNLPGNSSGAILQDLQQKNLPGTDLQPGTNTKPPSSQVQDQRPSAVQTQLPENTTVVHINHIQVEGATLLQPTDVQSVTTQYENKDLTFTQMQEVADKLSGLYSDKGLVTSRFFIPPQQLDSGTLILRAVEGKMGKLTVKEGKFFKMRSVKYGFPLDKGDAFDTDAVKTTLRRYNSNPDRNVRATLKPGADAGETDVELDVADRHPWHVAPFYNNLGRYTIGNNQYGVNLSHNNLLGLGDSLLGSFSLSRHSAGVVNRYELPIGSHGTRIGIESAYSHLRLGRGPIAAADITAYAYTISPYISQDIVNRERWRLWGDLAFDIQQQHASSGSSSFQANDGLRVLRPALNYEEYDKYGRTLMRHEMGLGLDILGGTDGFGGSPSVPTATRFGAGTKFFRYTGSITRMEKLPWNTLGIFRAIGQLSPDRLASLQQFQAGGAYTVRGYREGYLIGDQGFLLSAEWRIPAFFFSKTAVIPGTEYKLRDNIQLVTFVDYAGVYSKRSFATQDLNNHLLGAGVGLRAQLTRFLTARLDLGVPLLHDNVNGIGTNGARLHFGLESALF